MRLESNGVDDVGGWILWHFEVFSHIFRRHGQLASEANCWEARLFGSAPNNAPTPT